MATRFDLKLIGNDIAVENNDLTLVESDSQHVIDTINACQGWWKESFSDGVGILSYLKSRNAQQRLARSIKINLKADGYKSSPVVSYDSNGQLTIDPNVTI